MPKTWEHWSDTELAVLRERFPSTSEPDLGLVFPQRSVSAITSKAYNLGLKKYDGRKPEWGEDEITRLKAIYPHATDQQLIAAFPNRTYGAIMKERFNQGLKRDFSSKYDYTKISESEKAYFAGLFDGEGCIGIGKSRDRRARHNLASHHLRITLANTDLDVVAMLPKMWGGRVYYCHRGKNRPIKIWAATSYRAMEVLKVILPYLRIKKLEAKVAILFQSEKGKTARRPVSLTSCQRWDSYYQLLRVLKRDKHFFDRPESGKVVLAQSLN